MTHEDRKQLLIVPTPGTSYEEDMTQRDASAKRLLEAGAELCVQLHANLNEREIRRAIARYKGHNVKFVLAEYDSTAHQRDEFRKRWNASGGSEIAADSAWQ
jgi:hypothetical protein